MSFSVQIKQELCRIPVTDTCCAVAEAYGMLLYANTFSAGEIRIVTSIPEVAARIVPLFGRAFGVSPDAVEMGSSGRMVLRITSPEALARIFSMLGYDIRPQVVYHLNRNVIEEGCCRSAFLRGIFLSAGFAASPDKKTHLEIATAHQTLCREVLSLMLDMNLSPKLGKRKNHVLLYFKDSEQAEDFLTHIGAVQASLRMMQGKVEKQLRNSVNRQVNCETANVIKASNAAAAQRSSIRRALDSAGWEVFPDKLHETIRLRMAYPDASLAELAQKFDPPISKPGLSHRLKKIVEIAQSVCEEEQP